MCDSVEMRTALRRLFKLHKELELVAEGADGQEAIDCVERVLLMDIRMPIVDGLAATRGIRELTMDTRVLLTSFDVGEYIVKQIMEAGAQGYLRKDDLANHIYSTIQAVLREELLLTVCMQRSLYLMNSNPRSGHEAGLLFLYYANELSIPRVPKIMEIKVLHPG